MSNRKSTNILNLLSFTFLIYASFIFRQRDNFLTAEKIDIFFRPAPFAFSIWFVIYISLIIWIVKGFLATPKESVLYKDVGLWFSITMIFTGLSVLVSVKISFIFSIIATFSSLIVYMVNDESSLSKFYKVPFSLLTAWLSVATIVNISLFLKSLGFTSFLFISEMGITILVLILSTFIAMSFTLAKSDIIFSLVFIWAYIGIIFENPSSTFLIRSIFLMCVVLLSTIIFTLTTKDINMDKLTN